MLSTYKNGEVLAIEWDMWISGTKLSQEKKSCITSIEIKETVDGSDTCTININDPEFNYIEDNIFIEDNKVKIKAGWTGVNYRLTFEGYISAIDIDFPNTGVPKLTLTCMDNTHLMNRKKKNKTYKNTTSAEVVRTIVKSYGFKCVIDSGYKFTKQESITQSNQTDISFITQLAGDEVYPFTARLVGNTFYYVRKGKLEDPKLTLTYMDYPHDIVSFQPKITKETSQVEVSSSKITAKKKLTTTKVTSKRTTESKTAKGGSAKSGGSSSGSSISGNISKNTYTYNPNTRNWNKN